VIFDWRESAANELRAVPDEAYDALEFAIPREGLWDRLRRVTSAHGAAVAVTDGRARLTYDEFIARADAVAGLLERDAGVRPGDRVATLARNTIGFCLTVAAGWRLGAVVVPLNTRLRARELRVPLLDAAPRAIVAADDLAAMAASMAGSAIIVPESRVTFTPDRGGPRHGQPAGYLDPAFVLYTSGTTGSPKGARISHRNALQAARTFEHCYNLTPDDRSLVAVPIFHGTGLFAQLVPMLAIGGSVVLLERFDAQAMVELAERTEATHSVSVPTIYRRMLDSLGGRAAPASLHTLGIGGAPLTPRLYADLRAALPDARLMNSYGLTEATSPALILPPGQADAHVSSIGFPTPTLEARIVAPGTDHELAPGEVGELCLRGALVSRGRWGRPDTPSDDWLATGDLARRDSDGLHWLVDRLKDMVNVGGEKVFSVEVEAVLEQHPDVSRAAVVGREDAILGELPVAFIVPRVTGGLLPDTLGAWAREQLASYKVPREFILVDELPTNAAGKVRKEVLRREAGGSTASVRPSTRTNRP
jgi:long-chain acyl-CoA synthetase